MAVSTEAIRNVAVSGHGTTGKTSLVENLLFAGGSIDKPETINSGKTVSDFTDEEIAQQVSIHASLSYLSWNKHKVNLLDTPGTADFVGEVVAAYRAADSAVMVIDGKAGVEIETIKLWRRLNDRNMPRLVVVSKLDQERADFRAAYDDIQGKLGATLVPVVIPMGSGTEFEGVIDLLRMRAYSAPGFGGKEQPQDIPESYQGVVDEYRAMMVEAAAEGDDELTEKYLTEEDLTPEEVERGLMEGLRANKLVPVLSSCAEQGSGAHPLLDFLVAAAPSPAGSEETAENADGEEIAVPVSSEGEPSAFVFKTTIDQFSGKLSFVKPITGTVAPEQELYNSRESKKDRVGKIYSVVGKKHIEAGSLVAGDLGALSKLQTAQTNDSFSSPESPLTYRPLALPQPVYSVAIEAGSKKDEDKLGTALQRVIEEDKTIRMTFNPETKETVLSGMGELHLNTVLDRIRDSHKIELNTHTPKIAYRETITKTAESQYRHKKQSGGHGQFGEVSIRINPLERGEQYNFENAIRGMAISKGYVPGIEKGLQEAMSEGILAGYPVVDVGITLLDGKEHSVDSSEMAFKAAAKGAMKEAMKNAKPTLLEPIYNLQVFIDEQYLGDVLSDLSSRRGRVQGQTSLGGGIMEVKAEVPQAELLRYAIDLRSITSGTGSFEMSFSHYSPISGKVADEIIKQAQEAPTA